MTLNLLILITLSVGLVVCVVYFIKHLVNLYKKRVVPDRFALIRYENYPIIQPKPYSGWETVGTFNPAAIKDDEGFVHLFYRAIGDDGISRIGHAKSMDGVNFPTKTPYPVYVFCTPPSYDILKESGERDVVSGPKYYDTDIYSSGGSWGGCEDPRAIVMDGRVYMTYTAFEGWQSVRIALTSISMEDLKAGKWNWKKPKFISSITEVNKNWVLFPEKINGKMAILHSVSPKVQISYVDDINYIKSDEFIKSKAPSGGREDKWDNWMRGAGSPPVKTKLGWLLLYHAMDKKDPNKYKVGCMILDLKDPSVILYRSIYPILEPDAHYENDGKPGVVYASGALVLDDDLYVYYGGGDKTVCVAKTPLKPLLAWLKKYGKTN